MLWRAAKPSPWSSATLRGRCCAAQQQLAALLAHQAMPSKIQAPAAPPIAAVPPLEETRIRLRAPPAGISIFSDLGRGLSRRLRPRSEALAPTSDRLHHRGLRS